MNLSGQKFFTAPLMVMVRWEVCLDLNRSGHGASKQVKPIRWVQGSNLGPLHTWDWEPVTITFQALSLVDTAEPVQVLASRYALRDQWSTWMQNGCKVYMDSYMASNGSCCMVTWTKGHFTHETKSPWPLHFKHSHWWKRRSRSKFLLYTMLRGTNIVCECKMDAKSTWIPTWHRLDHVSWSLGLY